MTPAMGALGRRVGPGASGAVRVRPIAQDMTAMIARLLAGYSVVGLAPGLPDLREQAPALDRPWLALFALAQGGVVLGLIVQAWRRRPIRPWAGCFAGLTLIAVLTFGTGAPGLRVDDQPFLWWQVGLAVVCAGFWGGVRVGVGYGLLLALAWALLRRTPVGGGLDAVVALSEGLSAVADGFVVAVVAWGMYDSAVRADARAAEVYAVELQQAIDRAVGEERARLDQLIHDDVMTTLTAAAHSTDATTGRATALLANETLAVVDALRGSSAEGSLSISVLASLAEQTVRRVSPEVAWVDRVDPGAALQRVPSAVAESLLAALREAVRNAVHHAHAAHTEAELRAGSDGDTLTVVVAVRDDGRGFDPASVPPNRLGVRVSILEASRNAGVVPELRTGPGQGTAVGLRWSGPGVELERVMSGPVDSEKRLPVDFPTGQFVRAAWFAVAVGVGVGLATFGHLRNDAAVLLAMLAVLSATFLVLRPYGDLTLPVGAAAGVLLSVVAVSVLMTVAIPSYDEPDILHWHTFPLQLVLVTLVIRRRPGFAVAALSAIEAGIGWTCAASGAGWADLAILGWGYVVFLVMAVLITRVLRRITRRQAVLRRQEDQALDASVRQHVALVQRSLWVADLRAQARSILVRVAGVTGAVPVDLRAEALLLEATLRESIVARNVMSDELAVLTEAARRRGVQVRLVDSRHTTVPPEIGQALLDAVRRGLAADSVVRLVVRLAPEHGSTAASVLTEDADGTHLVRLDTTGASLASDLASEVESRGR